MLTLYICIKQSNQTCRACVTIVLCSRSQIPSFVTCHIYICPARGKVESKSASPVRKQLPIIFLSYDYTTPWGVGLRPLGYAWLLCPHPYPPRLPSLGVRALQGARHNILLASSKNLSFNNHQPCPGSSSKECCGKKWVWLPTSLWASSSFSGLTF